MTEALELEQFFVASFDRTLISARRSKADGGLRLLISNAIGANLAIWREVISHVDPQPHVITWDHRGLYGSEPPSSGDISPEAHARDALAVADDLGLERFALVAWSNGSRIALEIAHREPNRVAAMALVCGGYGHSPTRFFRYLDLGSLLPAAAGFAKRLSPSLTGPWERLVARPELAGLVRQSGLVGPTADIAALVELLRGIASCDLQRFLATYEAVQGDVGRELLREIDVPSLLVAGERDRFTPRRMVEEMARALPNAKLIVYEQAGHYLPIEYPERLADDLSSFLAEHE